MLNSRKLSARKSYSYKWAKLGNYAKDAGTLPTMLEQQAGLYFQLVSLVDLEPSHSSLWVYVAIVSAQHNQTNGYSIFTQLDTKRYINGLWHIYPPASHPAPAWAQPLVLHKLMGKLTN